MLATQRFGPLNEKQADYVIDISQAGVHLLALINGILDLAKVEAGKMELKMESVAVNGPIEEVVAAMGVMSESKSQSLNAILSSSGAITTDVVRFRQVLYNLLANALKYTPPHGKIEVISEWIATPDPNAGCRRGASVGRAHSRSRYGTRHSSRGPR